MKKLISLFCVIVFFVTINPTGCSVYVSENLKVDSGARNIVTDVYSDKEMGVITAGNETFFRLFSPNAKNVSLILFNSPEEENGRPIYG
jgi:hypothetical protein